MAATLVADSKRIESIDILRGFSLLGIIIVHMVEQYYAGPMPEEHYAVSRPFADQFTQALVGVLVIGKFYMIFSFLFGLSFFIQFSKSNSDENFLVRFTWRLVLLFAIGMIHSLHYRGDILTIYAVLGIGLLLFYRLPDKVLLWIAILLILNVPTAIVRGFHLLFSEGEFNPFGQLDQSQLQLYYNTVKSGTYLEILQANFFELSGKFDFQIASGRAYITFGLFLLGIYAGRKNFFANVNEKRRLLKDTRFFAWMGIIFSLVAGLLFFGGTQVFAVKVSESIVALVGGLLFDVFNACLATIYVMWIQLWLQKERGHKILMNLYPVGRMGLTTYLMQTVFGTLIYFSYGLGMLNEFGALVAFGLALVLFGLQIVFAKWWFTRFAYGPVEWVWRNLTYFKVYPIASEPKVSL